MTNRETISAFVDRINAHDVEGLGALMSDEHTFIDAHGNQISGREQMLGGWRGYFEWFPDYFIEVTDVFEDGDNFALIGFAGGSFKGQERELAFARGVEGPGERRPCGSLAGFRRYENPFRHHGA